MLDERTLLPVPVFFFFESSMTSLWYKGDVFVSYIRLFRNSVDLYFILIVATCTMLKLVWSTNFWTLWILVSLTVSQISRPKPCPKIYLVYFQEEN